MDYHHALAIIKTILVVVLLPSCVESGTKDATMLKWSLQDEVNYYSGMEKTEPNAYGIISAAIWQASRNKEVGAISPKIENLVSNSLCFILLECFNSELSIGYFKILFQDAASKEWKEFNADIESSLSGQVVKRLSDGKRAESLFKSLSSLKGKVDFSQNVMDGTVSYVTVGGPNKTVRFAVYVRDVVNKLKLEPLDYEALSSIVTEIGSIE